MIENQEIMLTFCFFFREPFYQEIQQYISLQKILLMTQLLLLFLQGILVILMSLARIHYLLNLSFYSLLLYVKGAAMETEWAAYLEIKDK